MDELAKLLAESAHSLANEKSILEQRRRSIIDDIRLAKERFDVFSARFQAKHPGVLIEPYADHERSGFEVTENGDVFFHHAFLRTEYKSATEGREAIAPLFLVKTTLPNEGYSHGIFIRYEHVLPVPGRRSFEDRRAYFVSSTGYGYLNNLLVGKFTHSLEDFLNDFTEELVYYLKVKKIRNS